jgi:hypothetical protein
MSVIQPLDGDKMCHTHDRIQQQHDEHDVPLLYNHQEQEQVITFHSLTARGKNRKLQGDDVITLVIKEEDREYRKKEEEKKTTTKQ